MTNYKKWETFDEDKVLAEIDEREKIVGSKQARNRPAEDLMTKTSNAAAIAREEAEILQSQVNLHMLLNSGFVILLCYLGSGGSTQSQRWWVKTKTK